MTFEQWWKDHLKSYLYSDISDEALEAAQSAARAAWSDSRQLGYDAGQDDAWHDRCPGHSLNG